MLVPRAVGVPAAMAIMWAAVLAVMLLPFVTVVLLALLTVVLLTFVTAVLRSRVHGAHGRASRRRHRALVARRRVFRQRSHRPVMEDSLQFHSQLLHFSEPLGSNVVPALSFHLLFQHPSQLFRGLNEHVAEGKGIDRSYAILLRLFNLHEAPFRGCTKFVLPNSPVL